MESYETIFRVNLNDLNSAFGHMIGYILWNVLLILAIWEGASLRCYQSLFLWFNFARQAFSVPLKSEMSLRQSSSEACMEKIQNSDWKNRLLLICDADLQW